MPLGPETFTVCGGLNETPVLTLGAQLVVLFGGEDGAALLETVSGSRASLPFQFALYLILKVEDEISQLLALAACCHTSPTARTRLCSGTRNPDKLFLLELSWSRHFDHSHRKGANTLWHPPPRSPRQGVSTSWFWRLFISWN